MKTAARIITITAAIGVSLSVVAARAADPPAGNLKPELCFELADGSIITGPIDAGTIAFQTASLSVVKIPVAELTELVVGLNDRPGFIERIETLIKALDSDKTRTEAQKDLSAFGPSIKYILSRHAASDVPSRRDAVKQVLQGHRGWWAACPGVSETMCRPIRSESNVQAGEFFMLTGTVIPRQFRIASRHGPVIVKLDDVHRIRPSVRVASGKLGHWAVELHDNTHIRGVMTGQSFDVQTHYGTIAVPMAQLRRATFTDSGRRVCVQCWNSDRIVGTLEPKTTISFKTDKGRTDLSTKDIAAVFYGPLTLGGKFRCIAFSPDGKRLVSGTYAKTRSGSYDKTLKVWDCVTGKELLTLKGHSDKVNSVVFSPDGKRLASRSSRTIKLWDAPTGKELLTLKRGSNYVHSIAFSPDGKRLASGYSDKTVVLWDTVAGKELLTLKGHSNEVRRVAFSPDGKRLASRSFDCTIKLWDTVTGKERFTIKGLVGSYTPIAFSPDGKRFASVTLERTASGDYAGAIVLWDSVTGKELLKLKGHSRYLLSIAFSPDGKRLVSGDADGIKFWDAVTGKVLFSFKAHCGAVGARLSPDGKRLAAIGKDKTIKLWEIPDPAGSSKQIRSEKNNAQD